MNTAIIIPAYKEHESIADLLRQIVRVLSLAYVVVVDDSPDNRTQNVVNKLQLSNSRIHFIKRQQKGGRGSAVIEGIQYALKNIPDITCVVEMDADGSHDPNELLTGITEVRTKTVVVASRYIKGSKVVNWPLSRRILSRFSNECIRIFLGSPLRDNTNGYRFYSKEAAQALAIHTFKSTGFILLSEEVLVLRLAGFSLKEIPTIFRNRTRGSSSASWREFFSSFVCIVTLRKDMK